MGYHSVYVGIVWWLSSDSVLKKKKYLLNKVTLFVAKTGRNIEELIDTGR